MSGDWDYDYGSDDGFKSSNSRLDSHDDFHGIEDHYLDDGASKADAADAKFKGHKKSTADWAREIEAAEAAKVKSAADLIADRTKLMKEQQERNSNNGETMKERGARVEQELIDKHNKFMLDNPTVIVSKIKSRVENRKENQVGSISLSTESGGEVGTNKTSNARANTYIKKAPHSTRLTNGNFSRHDLTQDLKDKVARSLNLKAIVATDFFRTMEKQGLHENIKGLSPVGKSSIFGRVERLISAQEKVYTSYVKALGGFLNSPNLKVNSEKEIGQQVTRKISVRVDSGHQVYTPNVTVQWDALRKRKLDEVKAGKSKPSFWQHQDKTSKAYQNNLRQHLSKVKRTDFYDAKKLVKDMNEWRSNAVTFASEKKVYGERTTPVTFSIDLAIPKWRASNGALMDDLITGPYNNPYNHAGSHRNTSGGIAGKVSKHFRVLKKQKEYYEEFMAKVQASPYQRNEQNRFIRQTEHNRYIGQSEKAKAYAKKMYKEQKEIEAKMDAKNAPLTTAELRSAFYNIRNVGGKEVGVRRLLNPEFRRPFIQQLSHAAGNEARKSIRDLLD
jgi:hypothetical protein